MIYPEFPNEMTMKKYYELIHNIAIFIPNREMGNNWLRLLDKYPVTPYLKNRLSLIKWLHFIHNKINKQLNKPTVDFNESLELYYEHYKPKELIQKESNEMKRKYIQMASLMGLLILIIYIYHK